MSPKEEVAFKGYQRNAEPVSLRINGSSMNTSETADEQKGKIFRILRASKGEELKRINT